MEEIVNLALIFIVMTAHLVRQHALSVNLAIGLIVTINANRVLIISVYFVSQILTFAHHAEYIMEL